jgi:hypothetical protein
MGFLDRLFGRSPAPMNTTPSGGYAAGPGPAAYGTSQSAPVSEDRAVARYKYLLRTAPPEQLEQIHAEAFAKLTPEQRQQLLQELSTNAPAGEQPASDNPQDLARAATRAEMRQPGYLQNAFGRGSFGGGMGGTIMGSMMGTIAGFVIGSAIANMLFDGYADSPEAQEAGDPGPADDGSGADGGDTGSDGGNDTGSDAGNDGGGTDFAGDTGGDWGGGGSDFGGGDFGGGDFGGGGFDGGF